MIEIYRTTRDGALTHLARVNDWACAMAWIDSARMFGVRVCGGNPTSPIALIIDAETIRTRARNDAREKATHDRISHYTTHVNLVQEGPETCTHATLHAAEAHAAAWSRGELDTAVYVTAIFRDVDADDVTIAEFVNGDCLIAWATEDELGM